MKNHSLRVPCHVLVTVDSSVMICMEILCHRRDTKFIITQSAFIASVAIALKSVAKPTTHRHRQRV